MYNSPGHTSGSLTDGKDLRCFHSDVSASPVPRPAEMIRGGAQAQPVVDGNFRFVPRALHGIPASFSFGFSLCPALTPAPFFLEVPHWLLVPMAGHRSSPSWLRITVFLAVALAFRGVCSKSVPDRTQSCLHIAGPGLACVGYVLCQLSDSMTLHFCNRAFCCQT